MDQDLTTDELLKLQETRKRGEPAKKRRRLSISSVEDVSDEEDQSAESADAGVEDDSEEDVPVQLVPKKTDIEDRFGFLAKQRTTATTEGKTVKIASTPQVASFTELGISRPLQLALKAMSIKAPTAVQAACIPPLLAGRVKGIRRVPVCS